MRTIKPSHLADELFANARAGLATMIWGPPGIGKSQIVYEMSTKLNAKLFELRANLFDPVDVRGGLKVVEQEDGTYKTRYGVPEDYPDTDYRGNVVLFIDELPNAPKATQNALLQLILDRKIGTYQLPSNTAIVAAGNRAADRAAVNEMPTPVRNRFSHYELGVNTDDWCAWAMRNDISPAIISFIRYRPTLLHSMDTREYAFPTPRSWEMVDKKVPHMPADDDRQFYSLASVVGDSAAGEFLAFKRIADELPDLDKIIQKPTHMKVPVEPSTLYALSGALAAKVTALNFPKIMAYANRMPPEYQVILVRDALAKDRSLTTTPVFQSWAQENAQALL